MHSFDELFQSVISGFKNAKIPNAENEIYLILGYLSKKDISYIISHFKDPLDPSFPVQNFQEISSRRIKREPLAYLFQKKEFYKRDFDIGPGVLIPRPETEHLVEWVLEKHRDKQYQSGLDLCTGSGIIGITCSLELKIPFQLIDISSEALNWAEKNVKKHELFSRVGLKQLDLLNDNLNTLPKADLITINPPYVSSQDMVNLEPDLSYEPSLALDGGFNDGLNFFEQIIKRLHILAMPTCDLFVELGWKHEKILKSISFDSWELISWKNDYANIPRIAHFKFKGTTI